MRVCPKCKSSVPSQLRVNGKRHTLTNRKYCLSCSPFKKHNTRKVEVPKEQLRICSRCDREYVYKSGNGCSSTRCACCAVKVRQYERKQKLVEIKGGCCSKCGYKRCIQCLCFHHRDPSKKKFPLTSNHLLIKWETILEELDKCDLLCMNCHTEHHYEKDGNYNLN